MAALYLHQALFTPEPITPPAPARHSFSGHSSHGRHLSSVSSMTLRAPTPDHLLPTEPSLHSLDSASSVYLGLLARQPQHPTAGLRSGTRVALDLEGDPETIGERKSRWERAVRRRLRRLRWTKWILLVVIGAWGLYNAARYYVAFTLHKYRTRQIFALALGTSSTISLAFILTSVVITKLASHFKWVERPRALHVIAQGVLGYSSSVLLFVPALANLVLVFAWRHSSNVVTAITGRCHWEIDVVWSGLGLQCTASPAWGFWVAGSLVRTILTFFFLLAYHLTSYNYDVTRQPSRRRGSGCLLPHRPPSFHHGTNTSRSSHCSKPEMSVATITPVSVASVLRSPMQTTLEVPQTGDGSKTSRTQTLRRSHSRIMNSTTGSSNDGLQLSRSSLTAKQADGSPSRLGDERGGSPDSSDEGCPSSGGEGSDFSQYGRQAGQLPGAYLSSSPHNSMLADEPEFAPSLTDRALKVFIDHFRSLVDQVAHDTQGGQLNLAPVNRAPAPDPPACDNARPTLDIHVAVFGRAVHRMPTIESIGSHERASLSSNGHRHRAARRSTPSNTFNSTDSPCTPSSMGHSHWDTAYTLSSPLESAEADVGELGEFNGAVANEVEMNSMGSLVSFHTAKSSPSERAEHDP